MAKATMYFPPDFLWGTATAAHQVEGNNHNNDWWQWEQQEGAILDGSRSGLANDWWENAEADLDRAAAMGTNAHRLSLEWSRIEPEPSVFDHEALDRYRQILQAMHERDIEPMVTLHHFSNPLWLVEKGDFGSELVVDYFQRYTARVAETLGDLVPRWITINEPVVYAFQRYLEGRFPPPAQRGRAAAARALGNMLRCHAAAYHAIKAAHPQAHVGVAKNMIAFDGRAGGHFLDRWWAAQISWVYNDWWMEAMRDGRIRWPLGRGRVQGLAGAFDFTGINYYTRFYTRFPRLYQREWGPDAMVSDGDYGEVYPEGLFRVIKHARRYERPIYITENGLPDRADDLRPAFLLTHLREVWRAISFNWPIMGYYHWTLVDNFEWDRGWTQRFGLIALDPQTQERDPRPSAELYQEICHSGSISSDMAQRYAPHLLDTLFPG
ncbi:MAG TPA: family 1 glycosylhydrolase [Candidatus Sulfomarinibacteraceae bacterium]|nr:family 1 glycosylhydrolase [Candidatus Sulfomarinibacteraceae bacterium]